VKQLHLPRFFLTALFNCKKMQEEIWRSIKGFNDVYKISNLGRVKSLKFNKEKILKFSIHKFGYTQVTLVNKDIRTTKKVHQLVAEEFLFHKPNGYKLVVDHINDNPLDNRVENLQIVTQRFNACKTQGKYSSKYKGVYWSKANNKWKAGIKIGSKVKYLGYFLNEYDAYLAYEKELNYINKIAYL